MKPINTRETSSSSNPSEIQEPQKEVPLTAKERKKLKRKQKKLLEKQASIPTQQLVIAGAEALPVTLPTQPQKSPPLHTKKVTTITPSVLEEKVSSATIKATKKERREEKKEEKLDKALTATEQNKLVEEHISAQTQQVVIADMESLTLTPPTPISPTTPEATPTTSTPTTEQEPVVRRKATSTILPTESTLPTEYVLSTEPPVEQHNINYNEMLQTILQSTEPLPPE